MTALRHLFVYGTLAPGRPNHHVVAGIAGTWSRGTVRGHLFEEGWGATLGYPAIVLDPAGDVVEGFVLASAELPRHVDGLDAFEGEGYRREVTTVAVERGGMVEAYVYVLREGG